jgi:hypothetical protein
MNPDPTPIPNKTLWHRLLGSVLEELLSPVGIEVYTDLPLMSNPPEADILLLRRATPQWTPAQLERLADGIRHSQASHILIEFKYTESVNDDAWLQTLCYDTFYKRVKHLTANEVQTFLVSAKTPLAETLIEWGYVETEYKGVYRTEERLLKPITLVLLNRLPPTPHNAFIKCFASRFFEKRKAFAQLRKLHLSWLTSDLGQLLSGLFRCWFKETGEEFMNQELNPERVKKLGGRWTEAFLAQLPIEKRLQGLKSQEVISLFTPQERLRGLKPQEVVSQFAPQELLSQFAPQERLRGLQLQERLGGLKPQELLDQLDSKQIEEYLNFRRKKAQKENT